jgi:hypothetical protein
MSAIAARVGGIRAGNASGALGQATLTHWFRVRPPGAPAGKANLYKSRVGGELHEDAYVFSERPGRRNAVESRLGLAQGPRPDGGRQGGGPRPATIGPPGRTDRADISPRRQNGLGSERGLATPSPDGKGREPQPCHRR